jgi:hypothetical protein
MDKRNEEALPLRDTWLLEQVLSEERLRNEFCSLDCQQRVAWNDNALRAYR